MTCPAVIEVITPGPPGPPGDDSTTITGPAVLGRAEATPGFAVALPLGTGLSIVGGALTATGATNLSYDPATRLLSSSTGADVTLPLVTTTAAGLVPSAWLTGAEAATLPHIHGDLAGRQYAHVRNVSGVPLAAGTPVCVVGAVGDTAQLEVIAADAGDPAKMPAFAVLDAALDATGSGRDGHGVISGETVNQNTAAFALRAEVFVAVGGGLTATPPTSGHVQSVGSISRSHASTGSLAVAIGPSLGNAALRNVGTTANTVAAGNDTRLSDAREWSAATVDQAEAEAGTATTRRAWTAERVRQAIAAWWTGASTAAGRALVTAVDATAQRTALGLGDSATRNVGTASTDVAAGNAPATALASHLADADPHPVYLRSTEILAGTNMSVDRTTTPGSVILNATSGGTPGGNSGEAQFNNAGAFAGASGLTYDATTGRLTLASFLAHPSAPATPASAGFVLYAAPATGAFSWKGANGFVRSLNATGNTADRSYQFQDKSGTIAHLDDLFNGYAVGNWIQPIQGGLSGGGTNPANVINLLPFVVKRSVRIDELGARVTSAVAASAFQLAIYGSTNGLPSGVPLAATGDLSGATATVLSAATTPFNLTVGLVYFMAANGSGSPNTAVLQVPTQASNSYASAVLGAESLAIASSAAAVVGWNRSINQTYGTWPNLTGQTTTEIPFSRCPAIFLKVGAFI